MSALILRNRQRVQRVNRPLFRRIAHSLLESVNVSEYELCIHFVAASEMARINWQFLQHEGSTDVITFDYSDHAPRTTRHRLHGEIFICLDDAVAQARQFRTTWQSELMRYLIHGVLHLLGHDDLKTVVRRKMKREENRLLRELSTGFALGQLAHKTKR